MYNNESDSDPESSIKSSAAPKPEPAPKPVPKSRTTAADSPGSSKQPAKTSEEPAPPKTLPAAREADGSREEADLNSRNPPKTPEVRPRAKSQSRRRRREDERVSGVETAEGERRPERDPDEMERRPSRDRNHTSMACHLFPKLSETNLHFHDIYWNYDWLSSISTADLENENDLSAVANVRLYKRRVRVSHLLRFHQLQPAAGRGGADLLDTDRFSVQLTLVDRRQARELVSNQLEVPLQCAAARFGWCRRADGPLALLRSNYRQPEVVLRLALFRHATPCGELEVPLLDADGRCALKPGKTIPVKLPDFKFAVDVLEPTAKQAAQADCLPDILLCLEEWIEMIAHFRRICAQVLAARELNPYSSTYITDPVVATFPQACERPRLISMFLAELRKKVKVDSAIFRQTYLTYVYPYIHTVEFRNAKMSAECQRSAEENRDDPRPFLASEKCRPFSLFEHAVHLSGSHALD